MVDTTLDDLYIALHPVRRRLLREIYGSGKITTELTDATGLSKRLIRFHMDTLEKLGMVESEYKKVGNVVVRYYMLTNKGRWVVELVNRIEGGQKL